MKEIANKVVEVKSDLGKSKSLQDLRRRVDITYRIRIIATDRLKNENEKYKKLNIYYSALVTAISVLSIGTGSYINNTDISLIVLSASISLTYFMFYIGGKNLQERAYKMEETFKKLDILKNKLDIFLENNGLCYNEIDCKNFFKQYEQIILSIENHMQIDYYMYNYKKYKNVAIFDIKESNILKEAEKELKKYDKNYNLKTRLQYNVPLILFAVLFYKCIM